MNMEAWRARLLAEKQELESLSDDASHARGTVMLDQQGVGRLSRMDAMQQQAMAIESERRRRLRAKQIEAALSRIASGDFGYCVKCGEEIPEARLEADATSPLCVACASGKAGR
jgi:DnaK suppressor protein